jgi:4-carboxymuconolactone decarboxylase
MLHHPRIAPIPENQWTSAQRTILETLAPYQRQLNVYRTLIHHSLLSQRFFVFLRYILSNSTLPPRDRELVILRVGWQCQSAYEWSRHTILARRVGLTDEEFHRIIEGPTASEWSSFDATLLQAVDELHEHTCISDDTWTTLAQRYTTQQLMDLVFTVGEYTLLSMALNSFGVQLDPETTGFPDTVQNGESDGEPADKARS